MTRTLDPHRDDSRDQTPTATSATVPIPGAHGRFWARPAPTLAAVSAVLAMTLAAGCDRRPESNGGPRVASLHAEQPSYPTVADLPVAIRAAVTSADQFVLVDGGETVHLGRRGESNTTEVSTDELLRAFWRLRGDPLGGRGAANPSGAPLLLAGSSVPAQRVIEVVSALWQHGARLAVGGGPPGTAREHPVRMQIEPGPEQRGAGGALVELGASGLVLTLPGEEARSFDECATPDTGCLAHALDQAADSGAKTVFVRQPRK